MAYYDFLNIVFGPLLKLPLWFAIIIMSIIISVIVIVITKYTTNQALMKELKDQLKEHQKQIKEHKNNPSKAMEIQKKAMEVNMRYMSHSLRPTLITFIPIILIFGWMNSVFAFQSIHQQQEFNVTANFQNNIEGQAEIIVPEEISVVGNKTAKIQTEITGTIFKNIGKKATWALKGKKEGEYILEFVYDNDRQQKPVLITNSRQYIDSVKKIKEGPITSIQINYGKLIVIPLGFWNLLGWLGTYIISSIIFTMGLRKMLKVY